jgi:hypothetical protein
MIAYPPLHLPEVLVHCVGGVEPALKQDYELLIWSHEAMPRVDLHSF